MTPYAVVDASGAILTDFDTFQEASSWRENYRYLTGWQATILERDGDYWVEVD